ncbi:hypothetical protein [Halanaerobium congolense]|jgi:hypothetical protein|uniref:Uncharacterized protein n=1 Tax=Halanaerobium congolense TaxID=54121 RepID=A0A4R7DYR6_9FIRM|nr:hypothetical protein [Halanaerobium congolense]TDS25782.1 hypothetical protein BY453_1463 [Halanaerobium congolense]SDL01285.1 hypothetical protein SAMN04515655_14311 [Halanaerobium congolense]SDM85537.1 hypothetical protein SAMN04488599_12820 [Halanaerobium congolense]
MEENELIGLDIIDNEPDYSESIEENNKALADQYLEKYGEVPEWLQDKLK